MAIKEHQEKVDHAKEQGARYVCGYCHSPIFLEEERFHCIECCSFDCCPSCFVSLKGCQEHINTLHQRSEIFKKHNKRKVVSISLTNFLNPHSKSIDSCRALEKSQRYQGFMQEPRCVRARNRNESTHYTNGYSSREHLSPPPPTKAF